jgi:hypothetical protein
VPFAYIILMDAPTIDEARAAKAKAVELLKDLPDVVGVGIAKLAHGYGVKINVSHVTGQARALPESIDGVPVRVEIVGSIRKR